MPSAEAWWERMACRDADPDIFEQPKKRAGRVRDPRWADEALALCRNCPVRQQCLIEAIKPPEDDYSWTVPMVIGGMLPADIQKMRRQVLSKR